MTNKEDAAILEGIADILEIDRKSPHLSQESIVYLLRMVWLGRFDKVNMEHREALIALSEYYSDILPGYEKPAAWKVIMQDQSHRDLAGQVAGKLIDTLSSSNTPKLKRKGFMRVLDLLS